MAQLDLHIHSLQTYVERGGARVLRSALPDCVHGRVICDLITLRAGLTPQQELSALVHEVAHWLVHRDTHAVADCTLFEYEAEAVEAAIMSRLGYAPPAGMTAYGLLSASAARVRSAEARICDALGLGANRLASEPQSAVDLEAPSGEEIVFEDERYGMGDFLGLPEAL
jgi:hypothetical protein